MGDLCTVPFLGSQGAIGPMELSHCDHRQRSCIADDAGALVGFRLLAFRLIPTIDLTLRRLRILRVVRIEPW